MNSRKNNKRPSVPKGAPVQTGGFFYRPKTSETKEKPKKNSLTTPLIIDIWNFAFEGGENYKIIIKGLEKEVMKSRSTP